MSTHTNPTYFDTLLAALNAVSHAAVDDLKHVVLTPVSGGDINEAYLATLPMGQQVFIKQNHLDHFDLLKTEATGLTAIAATGARCCQPLALGRDDTIAKSFLLLSPITSLTQTPSDQGWQDLAQQLAAVHSADPPQPITEPASGASHQANRAPATASAYLWQVGWFEDNFIGSTLQPNGWRVDWHEFFAEQRLGFQCCLAADQGYLGSKTIRQIEHIQSKLPQLLPPCPRPSLLHGDLWAGNALITASQQGYLIDPAVYVGHPEADIAMTYLFGGFDPIFYEAYFEQCPLTAGFYERQDIYNLYHYLNHLNLFGTGYLSAVKRIAEYYGGGH